MIILSKRLKHIFCFLNSLLAIENMGTHVIAEKTSAVFYKVKYVLAI